MHGIYEISKIKDGPPSKKSGKYARQKESVLQKGIHMLNIFINSTTFGQAMGATFNLRMTGGLNQKRITSFENCQVQAPIFTAELDTVKMQEYVIAGDMRKVNGLTKAVEIQNVRVNSLAVLIRELQMVKANTENDMLLVYIPDELLNEITDGKIKFHLSDDESTGENSYYSEQETALWRVAMPLIGELYSRLVFKSIKSCRNSASNSPEQADRANICASMYGMLLTAYKEEKRARAEMRNMAQNTTVEDTSAFA